MPKEDEDSEDIAIEEDGEDGEFKEGRTYGDPVIEVDL